MTTVAQLPRLTVNKVLVPNGDAGRFDLQIDGTTRAAGVGHGGTTGAVELTPGTHWAGETAGASTGLSNYITVVGGDCAADGTVSLTYGDTKTCTITNTRRPSPSDRQACRDRCEEQRDACVDSSQQPGVPLVSWCLTRYNDCLAACP